MAEHRWDIEPSSAVIDPDHPIPLPRRWLLSVRAAVLTVCLLAGAAAAFAVYRGGTPGVEAMLVALLPLITV